MIEKLWMNRGVVDLGKSIGRPERISWVHNPHLLTYHPQFEQATVSAEEMHINHYWGRDEEFAFNVKWPGRRNWGLTWEMFNHWLEAGNQDNPEYYEHILKYADELRLRLEMSHQ